MVIGPQAAASLYLRNANSQVSTPELLNQKLWDEAQQATAQQALQGIVMYTWLWEPLW